MHINEHLQIREFLLFLIVITIKKQAMSGYQFIHTESYSRQSGKGKTSGRTLMQVVLEADRVEGNCPHVSEPQTPKIRYGVSAVKAAELSIEWAEQAKDYIGRKLRKDGLCLLAGVISYPRTGDDWDNFSKTSIKWLKKKYGDRLKSVIEHDEESHPHLHFYVVPRAGERFDDIHQGRKAAWEANAANQVKGVQNRAYIEAMRVYQDEFSRSVAMVHALTRIGPGRRHLPRPDWNREKQQAKYFADAAAQYAHIRKKARAEAKKEAKEIIENAHKEAAKINKQASKIGTQFGEIAKSALFSWHSPSKLEKEAREAAEKEIIELKAKQKKIAERQKNELYLERKTFQAEIDKLKRINENLEIELNRRPRPEIIENKQRKNLTLV